MLDGIPIGDLSPWGLVGIAVVLILLGRLIPRKTHEDAVGAKAQENERLWTALTAQQEINREHAEQAKRAADSLDVALALIRALPRPRSEDDR